MCIRDSINAEYGESTAVEMPSRLSAAINPPHHNQGHYARPSAPVDQRYFDAIAQEQAMAHQRLHDAGFPSRPHDLEPDELSLVPDQKPRLRYDSPPRRHRGISPDRVADLTLMQLEHERTQFRKVLDAARVRVKQLEDALAEHDRQPRANVDEVNEALGFIVSLADCEDTAQDKEWIEREWRRHADVGLEVPAIATAKMAVEQLWRSCWDERNDLQDKIMRLIESCERLKADQRPEEWTRLVAQLNQTSQDLELTRQRLAVAEQELKRRPPDVVRDPELPLVGTLYKKGNHSSNWRPRHLHLTVNHLDLFDTAPKEPTHPKRRFKISQMERVVKSRKQPYAFKIVFSESAHEDNLSFDALNLETLQKWIYSLTWVMARLRGDVGPSSPRSAVTDTPVEPDSPRKFPTPLSNPVDPPSNPVDPRPLGVDVLAIQNLLAECTEAHVPDVEAAIQAMSEWLDSMCHVDDDDDFDF
eukprot:TRINITY_DN24776_c0_g1_i3.p1 TRINITY_DN24776_c0_g1~~TRINITY_DN24776_c0_g1_i3.p1  ORF type:complete len:473 (+),score=95.77 TRINITY_DN24776_c0_g1_i3:135-1553(+)